MLDVQLTRIISYFFFRWIELTGGRLELLDGPPRTHWLLLVFVFLFFFFMIIIFFVSGSIVQDSSKCLPVNKE